MEKLKTFEISCHEKLKCFAILFLIFYSLTATAQFSFEGRIVDVESGQAVPYANIVYHNTGVYSNLDGIFELHVQEETVGKTIKISCIGYKPVNFLQDTMKSNITYTIFLEQEMTVLKEVKVEGRKEKIDASEIVSLAIEKLASNPENKKYVSEVFFRQTHFFETPPTERAKYLRYVEAAMFIQNEERDIQHAVIKEVRRSDDKRNQYFLVDDSNRDKQILIEEQRFIFSESFLKLDYTRNDVPFQASYKNIYSLLDPAIGNLNNDFISRHTFKLERVSRYDSEIVYVISILPSKRSLEVDSDLVKDMFIPDGKLFISGDDYSILEIQYGYIQNAKKSKSDIARIVKLMNQGDFVFQDIIRYKKVNGEMYPSYIMREQADTIFMGGFAKSGLTSSLSQSAKDYGYFKIRRELIVNTIFFEKSEIDKLNLEPNYFSLYPQNYVYNAPFWDNYNKVMPSRNENKLLDDLGDGLSIKEQFIKNGKSENK